MKIQNTISNTLMSLPGMKTVYGVIPLVSFFYHYGLKHFFFNCGKSHVKHTILTIFKETAQ